MFGWIFGEKKRVKHLEGETKRSFEGVKRDLEGVGKWVKHLDNKDKQLYDLISELKIDLSSIKEEVESLRESVSLLDFDEQNKQLFKKQTAVYKNEAVYDVQKPVQTAVQTANFHQILQGLTANERLIVLTLMNSDLKLSYEDLARLLGKERATVRGQINSIKQKSSGLIKEIREPNGKKRVFIVEELKEKLAKYAKVRAIGGKKAQKEVKKKEKIVKVRVGGNEET